MKTFLEAVAADLLKRTKGDLSNVVVVFPNRRASLFLNAALTALSDRPMWSPQYMTISELFRQHSTLEIADKIKLIVDLHHSYNEVTQFNEPLEQFYGWGELMLTDFDDIDKHLADASRVFSMLGDLHELDAVDYLTPDQKEVIKRFFSNFSDEHNSILKERFLMLWKKFREIYENYRARLLSQHIAYEGLLYRSVIEGPLSSPDAFADNKTYVFVGFNLLNEVEHHLFSYLHKAGKALFYWDYDHFYMKDHEAGRYISRWLSDFPNALADSDAVQDLYSQFCKPKEVSFISASTQDLQARYIMQWLTPERIAAGRRTAIVMCDESILDTVVNCLPPEVQHVNITSGFPLSQSPVNALVRLLVTLYQRPHLTFKTVNAVLSHPYLRYLSGNAITLGNRLKEEKIYYPTLADLSVDDNLAALFAPLTDGGSITELTQRLMWVIKTIAVNVREQDLTSEALYRMYTLLNRLLQLFTNEQLHVEMSLYTKLLQQIIQTTTIPFHGEPLEGIQIMGVLETRNLDFDHLLVLSCNEGNMPAKVNDSSFIPHSIREAYGLTTVNNKVAIYAYYFHRMMQRASDVQFTYNNSTAGGQSGEMSRFMLQLLAESPLSVRRYAMEASQDTATSEARAIAKTPEMLDVLLSRGRFSASAFGKYLRCPLQFYFYYVRGINDEEQRDPEDMNNMDFGNIFHKAAELMYTPMEGKIMTEGYIDSLLKEKGHVTLLRYVDQAFREELFEMKDDKRPMPRLNGLQLINRDMVVEYLRYLLQYDRKSLPFTILKLEHADYQPYQVSVGGAIKTIKVGGIIDRLDAKMSPDGIETIRVIDYKTGNLSEKLSLPTVADIFSPDKIAKHSAYFLQAFLYASNEANRYAGSAVAPGLLYVVKSRKDDYSPLLTIDRSLVTDARPLLPEFREHLTTLLEEILNIDVPFSPTTEPKTCQRCIFHNLCRG